MTTIAKHDWENRYMLDYLPAEQEIRRTIRDSYPHEGNGRSQHRLNYKPRHCRQFETEEELNNWLAEGNELEVINSLPLLVAYDYYMSESSEDDWFPTMVHDSLPKGHHFIDKNDNYFFYTDEYGVLYYKPRR